MSEFQQPAIERPEVFRGHFAECFAHLKKCMEANSPRGLSGVKKSRQPIADFCGISAVTVGRWFDGKSKPIGEFYVRMMCFLDMVGYRVIELEKLGNKREFAELIGYSLLDLQQAANLMGYKNTHEISAVVKRKQGTSGEKEERMGTICKDMRPTLALRKEELRQKCQLGISLTDSVRQRKISGIMNIMGGLLDLLESKEVGAVFSDGLAKLPPGEKQVVLHLSDVMHDLSTKMVKHHVKKGGA